MAQAHLNHHNGAQSVQNMQSRKQCSSRTEFGFKACYAAILIYMSGAPIAAHAAEQASRQARPPIPSREIPEHCKDASSNIVLCEGPRKVDSSVVTPAKPAPASSEPVPEGPLCKVRGWKCQTDFKPFTLTLDDAPVCKDYLNFINETVEADRPEGRHIARWEFAGGPPNEPYTENAYSLRKFGIRWAAQGIAPSAFRAGTAEHAKLTEYDKAIRAQAPTYMAGHSAIGEYIADINKDGKQDHLVFYYHDSASNGMKWSGMYFIDPETGKPDVEFTLAVFPVLYGERSVDLAYQIFSEHVRKREGKNPSRENFEFDTNSGKKGERIPALSPTFENSWVFLHHGTPYVDILGEMVFSLESGSTQLVCKLSR